MSNMWAKPWPHFLRDGHLTAEIGTDLIVKLQRWSGLVGHLSGHYSVFHGIATKPPIHEACTVALVEQPNFDSLNICEYTCYHQLDAHIQNMILPRVRWIFLSFARYSRWRFLTFFTTNMLALWFTSVRAFQMRTLELWLSKATNAVLLRILQKFWIIRRVVSSFKWTRCLVQWSFS